MLGQKEAAQGSGGRRSGFGARPLPALRTIGGCVLLLLLQAAQCLARPGGIISTSNNNNHPSVNVYMSEEEVKKLLGECVFGSSRSILPLCLLAALGEADWMWKLFCC